MFRHLLQLIGLAALAICVAPVSVMSQACGDGVFAEHAIAAAQAAAPQDSCVLQEWESAANGGEAGDDDIVETWQVRAYERFLACYRSSAGHGAVGELGVDTEKRRIPSGTRFTAMVSCSAPVGCDAAAATEPTCEVVWSEPDCCYDLNHEKY